MCTHFPVMTCHLDRLTVCTRMKTIRSGAGSTTTAVRQFGTTRAIVAIYGKRITRRLTSIVIEMAR